MKLKILIILLSKYRQKADISKIERFGGVDKTLYTKIWEWIFKCACKMLALVCFTILAALPKWWIKNEGADL